MQLLAVAVVMLCLAAATLGVTIMGIPMAVAALTHDYITWGLAGDLLIAVVAGAGVVAFGGGFAESAWHAIRVLPAEYDTELATGAVRR